MALLGFSVSLLPHLTLGFSAPLLPHQRHGPAVLAGCRTGRPAGCRAGRPALGARPLVRTQVIAYHKPAGLIVSHNDELDRPTVYEHLAEQPGFPRAGGATMAVLSAACPSGGLPVPVRMTVPMADPGHGPAALLLPR